jgi:hypothetical protein
MRFLKTALPFLMTLALGILSDSAGRHFSLRGDAPKVRASSVPVSHSRAWLVIHDRPMTPDMNKYMSRWFDEGHHGVRLLARFNVDGSVSVLTPDMGVYYQPDDLFRDVAGEAASRIRFTPPMEDGKPFSVVAAVDYEAGMICADSYDKHGRRFGGCRSIPNPPSVNIISVEGAKDSEGWRVIYE